MRPALILAAVYGLFGVSCASAQAPTRASPFYNAVSSQQRRALVNSVLLNRRGLFGADVVVDGCELARSLGDTTADAAPTMSAELRSSVRGRPGACPGKAELK